MMFNFSAGICLIQAAGQGDMAFLKFWYNTLVLRLRVDSDFANQVLLPALAGGHVEFASLWLQHVRKFQYQRVLPELVEQVCDLGQGQDMPSLIAGVRWIVQEFGAAKLSISTMESLLKDANRVECMQFLKWLTVEGLEHGVTMAEFQDNALGAQWDQLYRVARLSLLIRE
ncbi:hypothetical protein BC828DRAFT_249796 [Blastocladiella britannica]|nr:hypothetical protein BC828DRAFT_249796 [Blastocladiella britannica]